MSEFYTVAQSVAQAAASAAAAALSAASVGTVATGIIYLGDPSTDGTWRLNVDSGKLKVEVRVSGSWVTKDTLNP
jgi:methylaspartate ammonia-lyase